MTNLTASNVVRSAAALSLLLAGTARVNAQVELKAVGTDHVSIAINGQPFSDFFIGSAYPKPFLAPLRTVSGLIVTRKYPMEKVEGESRDHPHHRGLFIGYGTVNDVNFWENEVSSHTSGVNPATKGHITLENLGDVTSGKKSGSVTATFQWQTPDHHDVLVEKRVMTFYADPDIRRVDVDATFTAKVNVNFADTKEGFFAIRVADSMTEKNGGLMTNSEGAQTEKNIWGKRADWVDYDGTVQGEKVGIAIFDNPENFNHPPRWHSRAYGLFAVNPFGLKEFDPNATGEGGHNLAAGKSMRFRYRVIVHGGDVTKKELADWYSDYAKKAK
jgi:hypothetical protein